MLSSIQKTNSSATRFQRESYAAAVLQEPHVIPIHDWGEIDGNLYIDMRLVKGQTLHDLIEKGPIEPKRAVAIVNQVAEALDAAHAERLIHRDVKPQNIIITPGDFAYLLDFGIARGAGRHSTDSGRLPDRQLRLHGARTIRRSADHTRGRCLFLGLCAARSADWEKTIPAAGVSSKSMAAQSVTTAAARAP